MRLPMMMIPLLLSASLLAACAGTAVQASGPAKVSDGVLTGSNGMTLYIFAKDVASSGKSACNGPCANNWPPLLVAEGESPGGAYSVVVRDDGRKQWAYKGSPLYYWAKDQKPGDRTGDGFNDVWHVAKP